MQDKLKEINNKLIKVYQNNKEKLARQLLIQNILKDQYAFLKMDINEAFNLLRDLEIPLDQIKEIYPKLI